MPFLETEYLGKGSIDTFEEILVLSLFLFS